MMPGRPAAHADELRAMLAECCCAQNAPPDVVLAAVWGHAVVSCKAAFGTGQIRDVDLALSAPCLPWCFR